MSIRRKIPGWRFVEFLPVVLIFLLGFSACAKETQKPDQRIIDAKIYDLAEIEHGKLQRLGSGDDAVSLVTVWGTPYEMGKAYGTLLRKEISEALPNIINLMVKKSGQPVEVLDKVFAQTRPFIPKRFLEEMRGMADGSGLPLQQIIRANMIGEASEWHCSLFVAWGKATAADGHLYQLRALDYEIEADIQKYPTIAVYVPEQGHPFANLGWAGVTGAVSGISSAKLAISEIGDDYDKENDTFAGMPFAFMLRDILQFDTSLDDAIARVQKTPRTTSLMYAIGDGEYGQGRALQTSHTLCNVFDPDNLEPLTPTHQRIQDIVYWGMSWNVPNYDGPLHDKLVENYGQINAERTIRDILPKVRTGSLQAVVYDLTAMEIWLANAKTEEESGPLKAYDRPFLHIDMNKIFSDAKRYAQEKATN